MISLVRICHPCVSCVCVVDKASGLHLNLNNDCKDTSKHPHIYIELCTCTLDLVQGRVD